MKNVSPAKDIRKLKGLKPTTTSREGKKKTPVELTVSSQEKKVGFLLIFVILMITLVIYLPSLKNGFVNLDDPDYVTENTRIRKLDQQHLKTIFTTFQNANYHPLTTLPNAVEFSIGGDQSAKLFHVNNLLLHLMNVLLVFWFTRTLLRNQYVAAVVALLFAIHPMHVESVVWVSERKDVLYTFFFFLSLNCYLSFLQAGGIMQASRSGSAENQGRKQDSSQSGNHRQDGLVSVRQFTSLKLSFYLNSNQEKKNRHQAIIDPVFNRFVEKRKSDLSMP